VSTLHIHLDESGDWKFNPKGSRYFILAAAWTYNPQPLALALTALRFSLVREGLNIDAFHASPDKQTTRDQVVKTLLSHGDWNFAAVVVEKNKINPVLREPHRFYPTFATTLLRFILRGRAGLASRVLIYADTLPIDTTAKREGVLKALKTTCAAELGTRPYHINSHRLESNSWIQVVDYCCWSVQRKWEKADARTYDLLKPRLALTELEVTARGGTIYY
jgi:hypothetical protein